MPNLNDDFDFQKVKTQKTYLNSPHMSNELNLIKQDHRKQSMNSIRHLQIANLDYGQSVHEADGKS